MLLHKYLKKITKHVHILKHLNDCLYITFKTTENAVESQLLDQEASPEGDKHVLPTCSTAEVEGIAIVSDFVVFPVIQK